MVTVCPVISNCHRVKPIGKVQQCVKGKGLIQISQSNAINACNEGMGGVDMMDRLLESYRPATTMKKWWFSCLVSIVNVSVVAAWRLFDRANPNSKTMHFEFSSYITLALIKSANQTRINTIQTCKNVYTEVDKFISRISFRSFHPW